jgi:MFS transporter, YNFM family, putative membrane transport protein
LNRLHVVAVLLIITGIFIASNIYTLIPIYLEVATGINSSIEQVTYGSSIFSLCYAVGLLSFGPLSEKIGRKKVLVYGLLFSSVSTIFVGFAFNEWSLYFFRGIQGVALASFAPVAFAYAFDLFTSRKRTLVIALINSGFLMAGILGQLLSTLFTKSFGWEYVFFIFGVVYFLIFLLGILVLPVPTTTRKSTNSILAEMAVLLKNKKLLQCYGIAFTLLMSFVAFYDSLGRFLTYELQVNDNILFLIRSVGLIGTILSLFTGKIIANIGETKTLTVGYLLALISVILLLFIKSLVFIAIISILFVASISLLIPAVISLIGTIAKTARGAAISFYSFALLTGASIGPILTSLFSFSLLLSCLAGIFVSNIFIVISIEKHNTKAKGNLSC